MKKNSLLLLFFLGGMIPAFSQTLFTYGKEPVDVNEFMRAYNKNNTQLKKNNAASIKEYLDLYIRSRLKVKEAYARGIDTLPSLVSEVSNLRSQIVDNYMTDPVILNRMIREAFQRSQKDIHVAHIFIAWKNAAGMIDSTAALKKRDLVLERLKKGDNFLLVAEQESDDPDAKENKGDLGYITAFTLPYPFENAIYSTATGKYTAPVNSRIGIHIFKNMGERKALGKLKAQQILVAIPPESDEKTKEELARLADSLYHRILAGDNFSDLARMYSNDYISANTGGTIPDITVGEYDPAFEKAVWALSKDSAVSKPFLTAHGWHIVKRISVIPVITDPENKTFQQELQQKIMNDSRWKLATDFIYEKVMKQAHYKKLLQNDAALWAYSDSLLERRPLLPVGKSIESTTALFSLGNTIYDADKWIEYARSYRFKQDGTGAKPYPQVWDEWNHHEMTEYYKDHLEDFNEDFSNQMKEFKEGNMFFEIMQKEVWNKAQNDSAALLDLYEKNKNNYMWNQSADVIVFFCSDQDIAKTAYNAIKQNPGDWRTITEKYSEKVIADSSRYEWSQIPNLNQKTPVDGMITPPVINSSDNTSSFAYIIKSYPQPMQRSFNEARGILINDYQEILEKNWDQELKNKYPVKIDEKVLKSISK